MPPSTCRRAGVDEHDAVVGTCFVNSAHIRSGGSARRPIERRPVFRIPLLHIACASRPRAFSSPRLRVGLLEHLREHHLRVAQHEASADSCGERLGRCRSGSRRRRSWDGQKCVVIPPSRCDEAHQVRLPTTRLALSREYVRTRHDSGCAPGIESFRSGTWPRGSRASRRARPAPARSGCAHAAAGDNHRPLAACRIASAAWTLFARARGGTEARSRTAARPAARCRLPRRRPALRCRGTAGAPGREFPHRDAERLTHHVGKCDTSSTVAFILVTGSNAGTSSPPGRPCGFRLRIAAPGEGDHRRMREVRVAQAGGEIERPITAPCNAGLPRRGRSRRHVGRGFLPWVWMRLILVRVSISAKVRLSTRAP